MSQRPQVCFVLLLCHAPKIHRYANTQTRAIPHCIPDDALIERCSMRRSSEFRHVCRSSRTLGSGAAPAIATVLFVALAFLYAVAAFAEPAIDPKQIPDTLAKKGKGLSALKAVMTVSSVYDGGKNRQDIKGFLMYRRPADFRFQGIGPGGNSLFELVIKANSFELYVPSDGKILKGGKECFGRRFPDVAEIEGLIPMVLLQWKDVRFDRLLARDSEKIVIRITYEGRVWGATLDPKTLHITRLVRLNPNGDVDLTADFGDFKTGTEGWLPRRFEVQSPTGGWRTSVRIEKIEPNPFLVEKNFALDLTFSAKVETCR
jgi:outer membrane lipoprotein-sorting protein